jgi:hypothetical protein
MAAARPVSLFHGPLVSGQVGLRDEGIDPARVRDPVYWLHPTRRRYERFDTAAWTDLAAGKAKL